MSGYSGAVRVVAGPCGVRGLRRITPVAHRRRQVDVTLARVPARGLTEADNGLKNRPGSSSPAVRRGRRGILLDGSPGFLAASLGQGRYMHPDLDAVLPDGPACRQAVSSPNRRIYATLCGPIKTGSVSASRMMRTLSAYPAKTGLRAHAGTHSDGIRCDEPKRRHSRSRFRPCATARRWAQVSHHRNCWSGSRGLGLLQA
jgi:hypothetical protein